MRKDGETRLEAVQWEGLLAYCNGGKSLADNPHEHGTDEWWMWRLSFLNQQEIDEYEQSLPAQVEEAIYEQPKWERCERLGVNDAIKRVRHRAQTMATWLGMPWVPTVLLEEYGRKPLREACEELCSIEPEPK